MKLKAQNYYMGKDTTQKQQFWSPEEIEAHKRQQEQNRADAGNIDDLEEINDAR
jgi:hypothetical protein